MKISSIELILKFLSENNIKQMMKWSERKNLNNNTKSADRRNLITKIRSLMDNISGGDTLEMIKSN
jgi:hypothetical protein